MKVVLTAVKLKSTGPKKTRETDR